MSTLGLRECPYFVTFLKINSLLYLLPFDIKREPKTGLYSLGSSRFRKITCASLHLTFAFLFMSVIKTNLWNYVSVRHDISSTFGIVSQVSTMGCILLLNRMYWTKQPELEAFISLMSTHQPGRTRKAEIFVVTFWLLCSVLSYVHGCVLPTFNYFNFLQPILFPVLRAAGLPSAGVSEEGVLESINKTGFHIVFVLQGTVMPVMVALALTTRKVIAEEFCGRVEEAYGDIPKMVETFNKMQELADAIKSLFGNYVIAFYTCAISFFAVLPQMMGSDAQAAIRLAVTFDVAIIVYGLGIAASAHSMMETSLRKFIYWHQFRRVVVGSTTELLQLAAMSSTMETQPIGISCSFFTITKGFLSSTLGLVVTYCIVTLQMDKERIFWELESKN